MAAIGDADAVICAVGARTGFNPKEFDEVDRKVSFAPPFSSDGLKVARQ